MQRWGWGEDMEKTDASEESLSPVVAFFTDEETKLSLIIFGIALLLITSRVYYSLAIKDSEVHDEARFLDEWALTFAEESTTYSETVLLGDGGEEDVPFTIDTSSFSDGYRIGLVEVSVSYTETNEAIGDDPCDSVQASMVQSTYPAQWTDENNTLNGGSTSCETIELRLQTYPGYDGASYTRMAHNEVIALDEWYEEGLGVGVLEVNVRLDVQQSQLPTQDDDNDETVQIEVRVVAFKASAEKLT